MNGIERFFAAIFLTGAVVGAAAFAHLLGRTPDLRTQLGLPGPGGPGIVQAAPLPAGGPFVLSPAQQELLPRAAATDGRVLSPRQHAVRVGHAAPASPTRSSPAPGAPTPAPVPHAPPAEPLHPTIPAPTLLVTSPPLYTSGPIMPTPGPPSVSVNGAPATSTSSPPATTGQGGGGR